MERVQFKNSRGLTYSRFFPLQDAPIVIMCHGFTSNRSSRGRFDRFAKTFYAQGFAVLKFDFSGCGESDDDSLTLAKQVDDLEAAVSYVKSLGYKRLVLYGHSLGSLVCLHAYQPQVDTMVLTGAGTGPMFFNWEKEFTSEQLHEMREKGYLTEPNSRLPSGRVIIEEQMLKILKKWIRSVFSSRFNALSLLSMVMETMKNGCFWKTREKQYHYCLKAHDSK